MDALSNVSDEMRDLFDRSKNDREIVTGSEVRGVIRRLDVVTGNLAAAQATIDTLSEQLRSANSVILGMIWDAQGESKEPHDGRQQPIRDLREHRDVLLAACRDAFVAMGGLDFTDDAAKAWGRLEDAIRKVEGSL